MERINTLMGADGKIYDVPESERTAFEAEAARSGLKVEQAHTFQDDAGGRFDVPDSELAAFEQAAQVEGRKVERTRTVRTVDGTELDVPDGQRDDFIREYRSDPAMAADREAARKLAESGRMGVGEKGSGGVGSGLAEGARRGLDDAGVTITKGIAGLPQLAAGLADLSIEMSPVVLAARALGAPLPAGGMAGRALERAVPLADTQAALQEQYSPEQQEAFQSVAKAGAGKGPLGRAAAVAGEIARHPTVVAHATLESLPAMAVGGAIGRAVSPVLAAAGMTPAAAGMTAGAIGEGVAAAGSAQEQIRAVSPGGATTGRQTALALGSGLLTGGIGVLANRLAGSAVGRRLGLGAADIDTMLAGGGGSGGGAGRGVLPRLFAGALQEGLLEELPQSAQEQIMQNLALGRPWSEGVIEAGVTGAAVGTAMGVGANIAPQAGGGGAGSAKVRKFESSKAGNGGAASAGPTKPGADIAAAARNKGRGGAVTLPDTRMLDAARKTWARFRTLFDPNRGVPAPVYAAFTQMRRSLEGAALMGRGDRAELLGIMRDLEGSVGRDAVRNALQQVQDGVIDTAMFSHVLGLPAGNVAERTLDRIQAANVAREKAIAAWPGLTEGMRKTIRDNANYQTRKYLRFILGDDYTPPEMAYRDAVAEIEAGLQDAVDRVARRAGALRGRRGTLDVVAWLETGNPRLLAGVAPKRLAAAQKLRKQYLEVRGVIDSLVLAGDKVTASVNAEAMSKAAAGWVDYYLGREGGGAAGRGGVDISSFQHRFLEGAFRALYGEITDPAVRQQLTSETQAKMLAQMTFFQRVLDEAEGTVWARMPDPAKRMDQKLGDAKNPGDRMRYGEMAGRFVTPEFKQLIDAERGSGATHQVMKAIWFGPMSLQRGAKLANPKTILRNYYTALQGFALGSGDATMPGFWRHFADGHEIAVLYARGDVAAIRALQPLFESGVFTPGASTAVADLQAALGTAKGRMSSGLRKFAEAYAFIDFPTKYAAYMARRDAGMTHEQAVDHVRRLYQNRDAIPLAFGKLSRLGMADYVNYTADSARIMANQLRWAADSIKRGDPRPLIGFALSRALWAAAAAPVKMLLAKGVGYAARKLRGDDKDKDLVESPMTTDKTEAFRMFLPRYDRSTPLVTSISRDSNGRTRHVRYTIMGGQSAFPLEDIAVGALQGPMRGSGYLDAVLQGLGQMVDEGMLVDTYLRTLTGEDIAGKRTPTGKGLLDALPGTPEPARAQIVQDALVGATLDMLPQYPIGMVKDLYAKEQKDAAGQRDVGIFARKMDAADILARGHRLVRSYNLDREDMNRMVRDRVAPFAEGLRSVSMMVNSAAGATIEKGGATDKQKRLAEAAQAKRVGYMRELIEIARAAKDVAPDWFAAPAMLNVLTKSGISTTDARLVLIGAHGDLPDPVLRKAPQPTVDILDTEAYQKVFGRDS